MKKLHLGCGEKFIPGWEHVDAKPFPHIDVVADVADLSMYQGGSADLIYACHVLEHFGRNRYKDVLEEWYRVLAPGGVLRLAVPDFSAVYAEYAKGRPLQDLLSLLVGGQKDEHDFHYMVFDYDHLVSSLTAIGFHQVSRYDWWKTEHADMDDYSQAYLPHMNNKNGRLMSLNVEAKKPN